MTNPDNTKYIAGMICFLEHFFLNIFTGKINMIFRINKQIKDKWDYIITSVQPLQTPDREKQTPYK